MMNSTGIEKASTSMETIICNLARLNRDVENANAELSSFISRMGINDKDDPRKGVCENTESDGYIGKCFDYINLIEYQVNELHKIVKNINLIG